MAEWNVQLTRRQQQLLLRGLRFARSTAALEINDSCSPEVDRNRLVEYTEIDALEKMLQGAQIVEKATV